MSTVEPPVDPQRFAAADLWGLLFWGQVAAAGWAVVRLSSAHIRVAGHSYQPVPMGYAAWVAVCIWTGLCLLACLLERLSFGGGGGVLWGAPGSEARCRAAGPFLGGIVLLGLSVAVGGLGHFVFLPATAACVGLAAGRLALVRKEITSAEAAANDLGPARWPMVVVLACSIAAAAIWSVNLLGVYEAGHLGYFDTGTFASRLVNTVRWSAPFRENGAVPAFWDHFNPGFYLLTPLAVWFDPVRLLLVAQCIAAAAAPPIWYLQARDAGSSARNAALVAVAWLLLPSLSQVTFSMGRGFHAVTLALPLVAGSLLFLHRRRVVAAVVLALLACSLRETVALAYVGLGVWLLSRRDTRKVGGAVALAALAYFAVAVAVVLPCFRGGESYLGQQRFAHLGDHVAEVLLSPLIKPAAFWGAVFSAQSLLFVLVLVGSVGLYPLWRGGHRWWAVLPGGLLLLLWEDPLLRSICYHYHAVTVVLVFWIALHGVSRSRHGHHAWMLPAAAATASFFLGWWPAWRATTPLDRLARRDEAVALVRGQVDPQTSVVSTICLAAHCAEAAEVTVAPSFDPGRGVWPEMFVLDYADDWGRFELGEFLAETRSLHRRLWDRGYVVSGAHGPVAVLRRSGRAVQSGANYVEEIPTAARLAQPLPLVPGLSVQGWSIAEFREAGQGHRYGRVRLRAYLGVEAVPAIDLGIGLVLVDPGRELGAVSASAVRPAGGMAVSSRSWQPGRIVLETHQAAWGLAQPPERGRYKLRVDLYDLSTGQRIAAALCDRAAGSG